MDNQDESRAQEIYEHIAFFVENGLNATYVSLTDEDPQTAMEGTITAKAAFDHFWSDLAEIARKAAKWERFHETAIEGKSDNAGEFVESVMNTIDSL